MSSKKETALRALSELDHRVMEVVWARKEATAEDVREALAPDRKLKESTVRTLLGRLEIKGYLKHRTAGRTYVYTGTREPQSLAVGAVRQILEKFCAGSVEQLVIGMVQERVLDARELRRLAELVEKSES